MRPRTGSDADMSTRSSRPASAVVVKLTGDGPGFNPAEHATLVARLVTSAAVVPDAYSSGGLVDALERRFARVLGKERAMFLPTGTLANHLAIRALSGGRGRVAVQEQSHVHQDSGDCAQTLSGVALSPLGSGRADFTADELRRLIDTTRSGRVATRVTALSIETPVRRARGRMFDAAELKKVVALARAEGIALHLDGARLFLAAAYTRQSVARMARPFDSVYVSLYKYFNAPAGAILAGPAAMIDALVRERRMFGGALAQAWPLALPALHALDGFGERYTKAVAASEAWFERLAANKRFRIERVPNGTNLSTLRVDGVRPAAFRDRLEQRGVELGPPDADGVFTIAINETFTRRTPAALFTACVDALA